jgi:hypothetical protein
MKENVIAKERESGKERNKSSKIFNVNKRLLPG